MRKASLIVATLSMGMMVSSYASAQVIDTIEADIPFGFTVRNTTLPAGHYTVGRLNSQPGFMIVRDANGHGVVLFLVESAELAKAPNQSELIFDRVGDQYFLSEIFEQGNSRGVELPRSRAERRLEKEGAMIQVHSVTVPAELEINGKG